MPANLTPDYHRAEARFREASSPEDRLAALEEMLRLVPKHKGTAKLQADLKARIARLRKEPRRKGGKRAAAHVVQRQGAGQVALAGPPNSGKSSLVRCLTNASPEVGDYPYTTRDVIPGMMPFEDVAIQLLDLPPVSDEHVEPWVFDLIRRADLLWIVVAAADSINGLEACRRLLAERSIAVVPQGLATAAAGPPGALLKPALLVVTGMDDPDGAEYLEILQSLLTEPWPLFPVSCADARGTPALARRSFEALGVIRVYTKEPGKPADRERPFTLPQGATVAQLARHIHNELAEQMRFARIWGPSAFDGQTVKGDHVLAEGDVVELHL